LEVKWILVGHRLPLSAFWERGFLDGSWLPWTEQVFCSFEVTEMEQIFVFPGEFDLFADFIRRLNASWVIHMRLATSRLSASYRDTIMVAGEPGDCWLGHRKMTGREESPDTVVVGSREPVTK
jgi:hypothetical protein